MFSSYSCKFKKNVFPCIEIYVGTSGTDISRKSKVYLSKKLYIDE